MTMTWRSLLPVLALGAVLALTPLYAAQQAHAAGSDTPTTDDKDKDKKEGKAYQEIQDLLKKAQFEPAAETTKVVGPRRQVRAALGVQAVTVDVAPEVDADDDLGGDLDYPAILRKQQA